MQETIAELKRWAEMWGAWIGPDGDRERYKRMAGCALRGAEAIAERDTLAARVAELEGALHELKAEYESAGSRDDERKVTYNWSLTRSAAALARTPAQSLAKVQAAALREAKAAINPNVLGNGDYYAGMQAGIESAKDTLEEMAQTLLGKKANGS